MTDAQVGRVAAKALVLASPAARTGRTAVKALTNVSGVKAQSGRVMVKVLVRLPGAAINITGERAVVTTTALDGTPVLGIAIAGERAVVTTTARDGVLAIAIAGQVAAVTATAQDGALVLGLFVPGEVATTTVTGRDGTVILGIMLAGEVAAASVGAYDGTVVLGIVIAGEVATVTTTALAGSTMVGGSIIPGEVAVVSAVAYDGKFIITLTPGPVSEWDAPVAPAVHAPSGDRFDDPIVIEGLNGEFPLSFLDMTIESGESLPTGVSKTIWLTWQIDEDINTSRTVFDTGFASVVIGTGDSVGTFTPLWSGEGGVAAYPVTGVKYMVQLGWHTGDDDDFTLIWESDDNPFYDFFETPFDMSGNWDRANLSTDFCSLETGEPLPAGTWTTAWCRWTPDSAGDAVIEATDPTLVLRVFDVGVDMTSLTLVASGTGSVSFTASLVPYLIQICDLTEPGTR